MKLIKTLRVRFTLWTGSLLLATFLLFGLFVYISFARGLYRSRDDALQLTAAQALATLKIVDGAMQTTEGLAIDGINNDSSSFGTEESRERGLTVRLYKADGRLQQALGLYRALPPLTTALLRARQGRATFTTVAEPLHQQLVRFYTMPVVENGRPIAILEVAQNFDEQQETLRKLRWRLLLATPLLIASATLGGYWLAARALAPIDHITLMARQISAADLSARLNLSTTDDEVGRLASTFDEMLARLDNSFQRERQFVANASHELRTPLAIMQTILSVIRTQRRRVEDYEQALDDIADEANRLQSLAENLLLLARNDTEQADVYQSLDLALLLTDVTDSLRPLAEAKGVTLTYLTAGNLTLTGDSDSLIRLFVNLLDNAIKYTEQGTVVVAATRTAAMLQVQVTDTGRGIPAAHLPHIFERFYRVDAARSSQGAGLGLAIAADIVYAHGGTITASSVEGKGTTFTVQLPPDVAAGGL